MGNEITSIAEHIVASLVDEPEKIAMKLKTEDELITLSISVAKNDIGKVIGRQGKIIQSIRVILKSIAVKEYRKRLTVIVEEDNINERGSYKGAN